MRSAAAIVTALVLLSCAGDDDEGSTSIVITTATASATTSVGSTTETTETTEGTTDTTAGEMTASTTAETTGTTTIGSTSGVGGFCEEACDGDDDCLIDGLDEGFVCTDQRCLPSGAPDQCNNDLFCEIIAASGIGLFCETVDECPAEWTCVALQGFTVGACAPLVDPVGDCTTGDYDKAVLPLLEGGEAEVCVWYNAYCDPIKGHPVWLYCEWAPDCKSDTDCEMYTTQPICGSEGACVCTSDTHCAGVVGLSHCVDGRCACTSDDECAELAGADACVDGVCGCNSAAVCPNATYFDGTDPVCEPA